LIFDGMPFLDFIAFFLQVSVWELTLRAGPVAKAVLALLLVFSLASWTIIFAKWNSLRKARLADGRFLRAFRKATDLEQVTLVCEQYPGAPMVSVFDFGHEEVGRQIERRKRLTNKPAIERALQMGISEEVTILERNLNWLATTATVTPFIGLFGTVWGIIDAFQALSLAASASLRAVGPGIADALVATAIGLAAAIPAAVFYNYFGHIIKEIGARMEDFSLEFINLVERQFEE